MVSLTNWSLKSYLLGFGRPIKLLHHMYRLRLRSALLIPFRTSLRSALTCQSFSIFVRQCVTFWSYLGCRGEEKTIQKFKFSTTYRAPLHNKFSCNHELDKSLSFKSFLGHPISRVSVSFLGLRILFALCLWTLRGRSLPSLRFFFGSLQR